MEKRNYVKPILNSDEFIPNEYVAACYLVKCNVKSFNELWSETNGVPGLQREDSKDYSKDTKLLDGRSLSGCQKWHKGVTQDPVLNGYICDYDGTDQANVFWWEENLGSSYDYHASYNGKDDVASNPNAS